MQQELERISRNVAKLKSQNVPQEEINDYINLERKALQNLETDTPQELSWSQVPGQAVKNIGPSAAQFAKDMVYPITNTSEWAQGMGELGKGLASKAKGLVMNQDPAQKAQDEAAVDAVGEFLKDRYYTNIKSTLANDPVGALSDASGLLFAGAAVPKLLAKASKVGNIARMQPVTNALESVGKKMVSASNKIDPLNALSKGVGVTAQAGGNVFNYFARPPEELADLKPGAVDRLKTSFERTKQSAADLSRRADQLGSRAFLADVHPAFRDLAQAVVLHPAEGKDVVTTAFRNRSDTAADTIKASLDRNMGPAVNIPETEKALKAEYYAKASPLYTEFHRMDIPRTAEINNIIDIVRRFDRSILEKAKSEAIAAGIEPKYLTNLVDDPMTALTGVQRRNSIPQYTGAELDFLKARIQTLADGFAQDNPRLAINLGNLAKRLTSAVDEILSPGDPAQSIYAQARSIAGDAISESKALEKGQDIFRRDISADQLGAELQNKSQLEKEAYKLGSREAIRSKMANAATRYGPNADTSVRSLLNAEENAAKLQHIIGNQPADNILQTINSENEFAKTSEKIFGNSDTTNKLAARELVPKQVEANQMADMKSITPTGLALQGTSKIANILTAGALNRRNARIVSDMANVLISQGMDMKEILRGLEELAQRPGVNKQRAEYIRGVAKKVSQYGGYPLYQAGRLGEVMQHFANTVAAGETDQTPQENVRYTSFRSGNNPRFGIKGFEEENKRRAEEFLRTGNLPN